MVAVAVPFARLHVSSVPVTEAVTPVVLPIVTEALDEHALASVTVTVYGPALSPEMEELVWPELQE